MSFCRSVGIDEDRVDDKTVHLIVDLLESLNSKLDGMRSDFDRLENTVMRALKILEEKMDQIREKVVPSDQL